MLEAHKRAMREAALGRLMQAACDDSHAGAQLHDLGEGGIEGTIQHLSVGGQDHPIAVIGERQEFAGMETTVLHEAGHWLEGHEDDPEYANAVEYDNAHGAATRGPWEHDADRRALSLLETERVRQALTSGPAEIEGRLLADARLYGPHEPEPEPGEVPGVQRAECATAAE